MINFVSMFSLAKRVPVLWTEDTSVPLKTHPYDWKLGIVQYILGLSVTFVGLCGLEGATLSLVSKVSPPRLHSVTVNVGTMVVFLSFVARILGDMQVFMVGVSRKLVNQDVINAMVVPLLLVCLVAYFLVKRHFFFLM
jgi:hypothetical protein